MKWSCILLSVIGMLAITLPGLRASKILAVYSFPGTSHYMMHNAIIKELINRGHQVTMITGRTLAPLKLGSNYTEVLIEPIYDFWSDLQKLFPGKSIFDMDDVSIPGYISLVTLFGIRSTELALNQSEIQQVINPVNVAESYDLLLVEQFYQEAFLALGLKFNIPVITTSTLGTTNYMSQMTGIMTPWSFVPNGFLPYTDRMSFYERLINSFSSLYEDIQRTFYYLPMQDELVNKYIKNLPPNRPSIRQMNNNVSLLLLNSYAPLRSPRPTANNMIDVGGLHIYPNKALPKDMQRFLDEAKHGAIYFSLGSNVQSKDMPKETLQVFIDVFSRMKQRILWKFEDDAIKDLPKNIMTGKWMPQNDILAHRNVKVFITHGGLFGTQEGVYHAVPMLGIPFYCDQHLNIQKAVLNGYALRLHIKSITEKDLREALTRLLEDGKYKSSVQRASNIFRDRPMEARDTAVYWIEYVIRHKGATHLRSAGLELNLVQFYLLDVIATVLLALIFVIYVIKMLLRKCFSTQTNDKLKRQ